MTTQSGPGTIDLMYDPWGDWYGNRKKGYYSGTNFTIVLNSSAYFRIRTGETYFTPTLPSTSNYYNESITSSREAGTGHSAGNAGLPVQFSQVERELALTFIQDDVGGWTPNIYAFGNGMAESLGITGYNYQNSGAANTTKFMLLKWVGPHAGWVCVYESGWAQPKGNFSPSPSSARGGEYVRAWPGITSNVNVTSEQWIDYYVKASTVNFRKWMYNAGVAWCAEWVGGMRRGAWLYSDYVLSNGSPNTQIFANNGTASATCAPAGSMVQPGTAAHPIGSTLHEAAHALDNLWYPVEAGTAVGANNIPRYLSFDSDIRDIHRRCLLTGNVRGTDQAHERSIGEWFAEACGSWIYTKYLLSIGANPAVAQPIPYQPSGNNFYSADDYASGTLTTAALRTEFYALLDTKLAKLI
jgi:hypothetical protein